MRKDLHPVAGADDGSLLGSVLDGQQVGRGCGAKVSHGGGTSQHQKLQQKTPLAEGPSKSLKKLVLQHSWKEVQ
jgi:hypothetical protein